MDEMVPEGLDAELLQAAEMLGETVEMTDETEDVKSEDGESSNAVEPVKEEAPKEVAKEDPAEKQVPIGAVFAEREKARREREARAEIQEKLETERAEKAALQAQIDALINGKQEDDKISTLLSTINKDLGELDADLPQISTPLRALTSLVEETRKENADLRKKAEELQRVSAELSEERVQQRSNEVRNEVNKAMGEVPELMFLAAERPNAFQMAINIDNALRKDPNEANKPMAERFRKVVEIYQAEFGKIELPETYLPSNTKVEDKLSQVTQPKVNSLSDIPSGRTPNSEDNLSGQNPAALGRMFLNMTQEQLDSVLFS